MASSGLPDYESPPVVETILSVQFEPVVGMTNAYLGKFWSELSEDWSDVHDAPPLEQKLERFADEALWGDAALRLRFSQELQTRVMIQNRSRNRMIQVQNGRFIVNWIGTGGDAYPRYNVVRSQLEESAAAFHDFLVKSDFDSPRLNQWEVTYLNHIPQGTVWKDCSDWSFFRPLNAIQGVPSLTEPENMAFVAQFLIEKDRGRLHIDCRRARRSDQTEVIALNLTARGPIREPAVRSTGHQWLRPALDGLDLGRSAIVRTFRSLMTDEANSYWGLKNAIDG